MIEINGKYYPLWSQFVEQKEKWIDGILEDLSCCIQTKITDIKLSPNNKDSAFFSVIGEDYTCGFDVKYGDIDGNGESGWLTFNNVVIRHSWRIKSVQQVTEADTTKVVLKQVSSSLNF